MSDYYLVFDGLHHGSALRDYIIGHLLSCLSYCANLKPHKFCFQ